MIKMWFLLYLIACIGLVVGIVAALLTQSSAWSCATIVVSGITMILTAVLITVPRTVRM